MRTLLISILIPLMMQPVLSIPALAQTEDPQETSDEGLENRSRSDVALDYMQNERWDFASYEWRKVLELEPDNIEAHLGLARSLAQGGFIQEAITHLKETRPRIEDPRLDLEQARLHAEAGQTDSAIRLYLSLLNKNPFHVEAFKGMMALEMRFPEDQARTLSDMLEKRAKEAENRANKAFATGSYQQAVPYYELAAAYNQKGTLHNKYALALLLSGDGEEAGEEFIRLNKIHRRWELHGNAALALLSQDETHAARKELEKAIQMAKEPSDRAKLYNLLGYVCESANRVADARYAYAHAIELDPALDKARMNLAYIYLQDYRYEKAINLYQEVLARSPQRSDVWTTLGFAYELQQEPRKAKAAYEKAIALDPGYKEAYRNLATMYDKLGKKEKADLTLKRMMSRQYAKLEGVSKQPSAQPAQAQEHPLFQFVDVFGVGS
ncbi:MAG TPA: tetratricopeptide repeat protein [Coleofasciculaceae cyanobacterium]|jgi:tetratricopeptide (TPR) repeat protein